MRGSVACRSGRKAQSPVETQAWMRRPLRLPAAEEGCPPRCAALAPGGSAPGSELEAKRLLASSTSPLRRLTRGGEGFLTPPAPGRLHRRSEGSRARDESSRLISPSRSLASALRPPPEIMQPRANTPLTLTLHHQTPGGLRRRGDRQGIWPMKAPLSRPLSNEPWLTGGAGPGGQLGAVLGWRAAQRLGGSQSERIAGSRRQGDAGRRHTTAVSAAVAAGQGAGHDRPVGHLTSRGTLAAAAAASFPARSPWKRWKKS